MGAPLVLVLGGTRSGKSTFGARRITELAAGRPIAYLATALPGDPELDDRIEGHRRARPATWPTIEVGHDLPRAIAEAGDAAILLDGLTLWLSALAGDDPPPIDDLLDGPIAAGFAALGELAAPVVVVSDEIGLGIVPIDPGSRRFRDLQGIAHQRLAALADEVHLLVAGQPLRLKPAP